ncbi:MAG TPA: hypothetical protein VMI32_14705 [Candidatus Solibacter sp.]|nr:hypothetical protein [Candidatus Solibacter sp.]
MSFGNKAPWKWLEVVFGVASLLIGLGDFWLSNQYARNLPSMADPGKRVGLHAFRHCLASLLLQSTGVAVAQRQLRHADAATTLGHYGHVLRNDHREAMDAIESVFFEPSGSQPGSSGK